MPDTSMMWRLRSAGRSAKIAKLKQAIQGYSRKAGEDSARIAALEAAAREVVDMLRKKRTADDEAELGNLIDNLARLLDNKETTG